MKRLLFNSKKIMGLVALMFTMLTVSCSNEENEMINFGNEDYEILVYAENFGKLHNECLDYCYDQLNSMKLRSSKNFASEVEFYEKIVEFVNQYTKKEYSSSDLRNSNVFISLDLILSVTNEDIRKKMSSLELSYIDQIFMKEPTDKKAIQELLLKLLTEKDLSNLQKKGVASFISVYQQSSEYWDERLQDWMNLKKNSIEQFKMTKVASWVVSDCYWGWFGTVSSGGNAIVGAGAATVASVCSAL